MLQIPCQDGFGGQAAGRSHSRYPNSYRLEQSVGPLALSCRPIKEKRRVAGFVLSSPLCASHCSVQRGGERKEGRGWLEQAAILIRLCGSLISDHIGNLFCLFVCFDVVRP